MAYKIDADACIGCGSCASVCPVGCIKQQDDLKYAINPDECIECGSCAGACPVNAPKQS